MKKNKPKTMGKNIDRDVELCRTTNARVSSQMMRTLVSHEIHFIRELLIMGRRKSALSAHIITSISGREGY